MYNLSRVFVQHYSYSNIELYFYRPYIRAVMHSLFVLDGEDCLRGEAGKVSSRALIRGKEVCGRKQNGNWNGTEKVIK